MQESKITKAYRLVEEYNGDNNLILYFKTLKKKKKLFLKEFDVEYVVNNIDFKTFAVNKVVKITEEFGLLLKEKYELEFIPKVLYITRVIGKMGNSYHCYAQYRQSVLPRLMYIPSKHLLDDINMIKMEDKDVDFSIVDAALEKNNMSLKPHQRTAVEFLVKNKQCILADGMGLGKQQPNDTLIPTPDGFKQLGNIRVGDKVFGSNGKPCNVIGVFPQGYLESYRIKFSDGTSTECGLEHLWIVYDIEEQRWCVKSVADILQSGLCCFNSTKNRYKIPYCKPVEHTPIEHIKTSSYMGTLCAILNDSRNYNEKEPNIIYTTFTNIYTYLCDTIENRKNFLHSFMSKNDKDNNSIETKDFVFADFLCKLISSIGGSYKYSESKSKKTFYIRNINIHKPEDFEIEDYNDYENQHKEIVSIKKERFCENTCIRVDSEDSSYLTEGYIVTHNTIDSISASIAANCKKTLIITTASLKSNWERELSLFEPSENISVLNGSAWEDSNKFTILNYDIIQNFYKVAEEPLYENYEIKDNNGNVIEVMRVPVMVKDKKTGKEVPKMVKSRNKKKQQECLENSPLFQTHYDCVIIDEAQKLSNNKSIRYKTIYDFLQKTKPEYIFLISGTPLTNRPINLYHVLRLINADVTKDYKYFVTRYCGGKEIRLRTGNTIMTMNNATNLDELKEKIKNIYIRRLSSEIDNMVNKDIVKKIYTLSAEQRDVYSNLWKEYIEAQTSQGKETSEEYRKLVEGIVVRQYLAREMVLNTISLVDDYIDSGEKAVIITTFQDEMDKIAEHYGKKCVCYNGKMTSKQKDKAEKKFKEDDKVQVLIGNVIACGVGLNLPNAKLLVFNSYDWVAANNKQAEDRIYRLTSTDDVTCVYQLFDDSISRDMFEKVLYKEQIMDNVIKSEQNK